MQPSVLVVEDEQSLRESFAFFLTNSGYHVVLAQDYEQAMAALDQDQIRVMVTDILLGPRNGLDLLRAVRNMDLPLPVICITGQPDTESISRALRLGAFDYLVKPVTKDQLLSVVRKALAHHTLLLHQRELETENERYRRHLEDMVSQRTQDLEEANQRLTREIAERRLAEAAIRESENKYRSLFELESDALFLIDDRDGTILEVNAAAVEMYGHSREELLAMCNTDLSAEPDQTSKATRDQATRIPLRYHKTRDGQVLPVEITATHFVFQGRQVHLAAIRDISQRIQAQEELRLSQLRFHEILHSANHIQYRIDLVRDTYDYVSDFITEATGYTPDEIIALDMEKTHELIHPDDRESMGTAMSKALAAKGRKEVRLNLTFRMRTGHGVYRWFDDRITVLFNDQNRPTAMVGSAYDITDLRLAQERLQGMVQHIDQGIVVCEPMDADPVPQDFRILEINPGAMHMSDLGSNHVGQSLTDALPAPGRTAIIEALRACHRDRQAQRLRGVLMENGQRRGWRDYLVYALPSGELVLMYRDATDRERSARLSLVHQRLKEVDKLKTAFLAAMSHELRTPLTAIHGFASIIRRDSAAIEPHLRQTDPKAAERVKRLMENTEIVLKEGRRLSRLIQDVLDLTSITADEMTWRDRETDLTEVLRGAVMSMEEQFRVQGLRLTTDIAPDLPTLVLDPSRITQVLVQILDNASAHTESGQVTVTAHPTDQGGTRITIKDTGQGIPGHDLESIFTPFHAINRQDTVPTPPAKGVGLGLALCRAILDHYGGTISAHSEPGQGSEFVITLPGPSRD